MSMLHNYYRALLAALKAFSAVTVPCFKLSSKSLIAVFAINIAELCAFFVSTILNFDNMARSQWRLSVHS